VADDAIVKGDDLKVADFIDTVPPAFTMSIEVGINI
jgi:hypothetical protein